MKVVISSKTKKPGFLAGSIVPVLEDIRDGIKHPPILRVLKNDFNNVKEILQRFNTLKDLVLADAFQPRSSSKRTAELAKLSTQFEKNGKSIKLRDELIKRFQDLANNDFPDVDESESRTIYFIKIVSLESEVLSALASQTP